ncbi:type II toxin-antitoxin system VapC family toxin [Sphingomonas sp. PL-96]|uniref:type II toxin-antitoxin system VapC family toxin n=1 Tax=Sphingomonas sp. PL-96 TaxID=2887201 RepID=UPI001E61B06A|nr:type II toxin-antitoxin system VapC family toxin [Sphingomonas sp. PL-96]MCC2977585.1 type II toxin-antitoxin system VapC family toxin [Sphingomonas sp. PL-96]
MKAVDTNVLARLILQDEPNQARLAETVVREPIWVSHTVWIELGWVLGRRLRLDRVIVADALETLLMLETVHVADRDGLLWAVDRYRKGADWGDVSIWSPPAESPTAS